MAKLTRPQQPKSNKRAPNPRVIMVKMIKIRLPNALNKDAAQANLINISATGAQFYSNQFIETHGLVTLELDSLDGSHTVTFLGKAVWARKNPMKTMGRYAYGVNFENMTAEHSKFLELNYSLGPVSS
jgi:hypothetical protein